MFGQKHFSVSKLGNTIGTAFLLVLSQTFLPHGFSNSKCYHTSVQSYTSNVGTIVDDMNGFPSCGFLASKNLKILYGVSRSGSTLQAVLLKNGTTWNGMNCQRKIFMTTPPIKGPNPRRPIARRHPKMPCQNTLSNWNDWHSCLQGSLKENWQNHLSGKWAYYTWWWKLQRQIIKQAKNICSQF